MTYGSLNYELVRASYFLPISLNPQFTQLFNIQLRL